ncbi:unnamed protein product [Cyclocybe aegerita]|uniref:BTB domain-containing protein n=1 Tax=Cyclocybe aegerita TaxID=1973307 RepID=A0A8S0VZC8_CYCAE|nr:unnamed protein product [Cyclocybe aegerita]
MTVRRSQRLESVPAQLDVGMEDKKSIAPPTPISQGKRKHDEVETSAGVVEEEASPPKAQKTYVKNEDHWALDGNLLLQIGDTRFKVHRSRLASESSWFQLLVERAAGRQEDGFEDQDEIDPVVETKEKVDDLDLFYVDCSGGPSSEQFATLLDAMNTGIDFVYKRPNIDAVEQLYGAASFFRVTRYNNFCSSYLTIRFPDSWTHLLGATSPDAAKGIILGRAYGDAILRHCFYDLARSAPPVGTADENNNADEYDPLEELEARDLVRLLFIQKRLAAAWNEITYLVDHKCAGTAPGECKVQHTAPKSVIDRARKNYPLDPILAIRHFIDIVKWPTHKYCDGAIAAVRTSLEKKRESIWEDLNKWIG